MGSLDLFPDDMGSSCACAVVASPIFLTSHNNRSTYSHDCMREEESNMTLVNGDTEKLCTNAPSSKPLEP